MPKRFQSLEMEKLTKSSISLLPDWQRGSKKKKRNFFPNGQIGQPNLTVCFTTYNNESELLRSLLWRKPFRPWWCRLDCALLSIHQGTHYYWYIYQKLPGIKTLETLFVKINQFLRILGLRLLLKQWWTSSEGHLFRQWKLILNSYWILLKVACHECLIKD